MVRTVLFSFVAALALAVAATPAQADDCGCGYGAGFGYGYNGFWGAPLAYSQGSAYVPPYYAIHPPVYYSPHIIARPYGWSPFAWPSTALMPAAPVARPMVIMNAHVKTADSRVAEAKPQMIDGIQPEEIANPFFVSK